MDRTWAPYAPEWVLIGPSRKRLMERMCSEPPGRIWEWLVGSRKIRESLDKNREASKITRCLMGSLRGPGLIEPAGIGPYRQRLLKRLGLGPSRRIFGLPIFIDFQVFQAGK